MKRKVIRSGILLICLLSPFIIWRLLLRQNVHRQLAVIRAGGLPTNARELDEWYAAVPNPQNVALVLTQAIALCDLQSGTKVIGDFKLPARGKKLSPEQAELLRRQITADSAALAKVDEGLKLAGSRYPIDLSMGLNTPLPHLAYLKRFAILNQCKAELAMEAGEFDRVATNAGSILGLAGTLDKEPSLISQLARLNLINMAAGTLERRVNASPMGALEITNLAAEFERTAGATNQLALALIGERAMLASYFNLSKEDAARMLSPAKDKETEQSFPRHRSFALQLAGFYDLDQGYFLYAMGKSIELAGESENLRIANYLMRAGEKARERYYFVSSQLSTYGASIPRQVEGEARLRLALTALAIERFRNQNSRLPETLDELTPDFLAEVLEDPFDGEPLRYRRLETGYTLYSVGRDREDNGGKEKPEGKTYAGRTGYDIAFTVER